MRAADVQPRPCRWCAKPFKPSPTQLKHGMGKFCSLQCLGQSRKIDPTRCRSARRQPLRTLSCEQCGKAFKGKTARKCRVCITVAAGRESRRRHPITGPLNPLWKGGISGTPEAYRRYHKNYLAKHPEKYAARAALRAAVRNGTVKRSACADCGSADRLEGHHHDYSKPLDVTWLCRPCHRKRHVQGATEC